MTPTPEKKKISMHLRCNLTDDEKLDAGRELAEATNTLTELENDKKRVNDDFKSKVSAAEAEVGVLSNKLRSGYEFRNVECDVVFDDPEPGKKTIYRNDVLINDTPVPVKVETQDMTEAEKQLQLPNV